MRRRLAVFYHRLVNRTAVVILPNDGVAVARAVVGRRIGGIACNSHHLRCPACEGVGVLRRSRFGRVSMCWRLAVFYHRLVN